MAPIRKIPEIVQDIMEGGELLREKGVKEVCIAELIVQDNGNDIEGLNAAIREACEAHNFHCIDVSTITLDDLWDEVHLDFNSIDCYTKLFTDFINFL